MFSFNEYFHYFFVIFFAFSAIAFWYLDRKRWADYRKAAQESGLKFSQTLPHELQVNLAKQFDFFAREALQVYSALFSGIFADRSIHAFHYAYQGTEENLSFRRGFACFTMGSVRKLPRFRLWPASRKSPFPGDPHHLQAFFPNSQIKDQFQVRGQDGQAVYDVMSEAVMAWLLAQANVVMECREDAVLIALEDEWSPQNLSQMLHACHTCLTNLEASVEMNSA